jgi:hypothetical protein
MKLKKGKYIARRGHEVIREQGMEYFPARGDFEVIICKAYRLYTWQKEAIGLRGALHGRKILVICTLVS